MIDILVGATSAKWDRCNEPLEPIGYDYAAGTGLLELCTFADGNDKTDCTHLKHSWTLPASNGEFMLLSQTRRDTRSQATYTVEKRGCGPSRPSEIRLAEGGLPTTYVHHGRRGHSRFQGFG